MAHVIHFIVVNGNSHEEVEAVALRETEDIGCIENWRRVIGSVDKLNHIHQNPESYSWEMMGLDKIKSTLEEFISDEGYPISKDMDEKSKLYAIYKNAEHAYNTYLEHPLDIWQDEMNGCDFTKVGITNMLQHTKGDQPFIVALDTHI